MPTDFIVTYSVMGLLFLRQVMIFKQPNKIDYAPLLLGVGSIGSLVHLMLHPESDNPLLLFRESLLPFFAGLILFMIMNILQQARRHRERQSQREFVDTLISRSERLQGYVAALERNQHRISAQEDSTRDTLSVAFETEQRSLETIRKSQNALVEKIESMLLRQETLFERLEQFTQREIPDLDNVVHRHIDMLRISEQGHFNQIKKQLESIRKHPDEEAAKSAEPIDNLLARLEGLYREAGRSVAQHAGEGLAQVVEELSERFTVLKVKSEGVSTILGEDEKSLREMRTQSELLMKQILVCAKSTGEIASQSERLRELYEPLGALSREVSAIHGDYVASKLELEKLARSLQEVESGQVEQLRHDIEALETKLNRTIDESLSKLYDHYHIAQKEISNTVQELSARAKLQQSYRE